MDKQPRPMWENILNTLDADPPANKIARQRRKLPAGNFDPGRNRWLCHVPFGFWHLGFVVTTTWVPTSCTSTCGLSALQLWQKPNSRSNWLRNTMCLGSVRMFVPCADILKQKEKNGQLTLTSYLVLIDQGLFHMLRPGILIPLLKWVPDIAKQTVWCVTTMRLGFLRAL